MKKVLQPLSKSILPQQWIRHHVCQVTIWR